MHFITSCVAIATMAILGLCLALSLIFCAKAISRQPESASSITTSLLIIAGMIEFIIILVFVCLLMG